MEEQDKIDYYNLYNKQKVFRDYRGNYISVYNFQLFDQGILALREITSICTKEKEELSKLSKKQTIPYLISKNVIVPFKNYTIEDILELNWVEIKNTSNDCC